MRLRSKIHLYSSVLFTVLLIVMNLSIYYTFSSLSDSSQMQRAEAEGARIAAGMRQASGQIAVEELLRAYVPVDGMLRLVRQQGKGPAPVTSPSASQLSRMEAVYNPNLSVKRIKFEGHSYILVSVPVIWTNGEIMNVQLTESMQAVMDTLAALRLVLIGVTAAALVPVLISSRVLARLIMQPIKGMTSTMKEIRRSGRFRRMELDTRSRDELVDMGVTFNEMIDLLQSNYEKQEKFVSNASHELKTPITIIESYASLLKRRGMERPELFQESVDAIHSEAVRMKEMTEQLLLLASPKEQWNVTKGKIDLFRLAAESAKAFRNAYGREVEVEAAGSRAAYAYSDEKKLKQLLFIFLDNARKYSEDQITLTVGESDAERFIRITDRGVGIPKEHLTKVFDRFYRVDEARKRTSGGAGLGLALAAEIAEATDIRLELDSLEGVGTTAVIWIKASPEE
ncbi:sensor histidine kinase [Paenibacillus terreus]|uniref:histidine kinase n=1 Tax=Paenibacillus terreus TaxID=1387834 RepID=A0ABV5B5S8_9BACL